MIESGSARSDRRGKDAQALHDSEERFRQVVEHAPSAMVMTNHLGIIELVNSQAEHVFGYARDELIGCRIEMLIPERFGARHPALRGAFFGNATSRAMGTGRDLFGLTKDGREFPVEIGLNPIETDAGTIVVTSIVDISERKRLERRLRVADEAVHQAQRMESLGSSRAASPTISTMP